MSKKFKINGIYEMQFFIEVRDNVIEAKDEEEAIEKVQDTISAGEAYNSNCFWVDDSLTVVEEC